MISRPYPPGLVSLQTEGTTTKLPAEQECGLTCSISEMHAIGNMRRVGLWLRGISDFITLSRQSQEKMHALCNKYALLLTLGGQVRAGGGKKTLVFPETVGAPVARSGRDKKRKQVSALPCAHAQEDGFNWSTLGVMVTPFALPPRRPSGLIGLTLRCFPLAWRRYRAYSDLNFWWLRGISLDFLNLLCEVVVRSSSVPGLCDTHRIRLVV
ncbi:uncharacterized protein isoform X1 [Castor canadensis]|uniref:Uncharacterized protein isoform X1 n=1 Tax=Castor canadensis TaxID=51338 RepID=A0AC58MIY2_CASCN